MSLRDIGRLGAGSSVRADLDAYLDELEHLNRFARPGFNENIRAYAMTLPAMNAGERTVVQQSLGELNNPNKLIMTVFLASSTDVNEVSAFTLMYNSSLTETLKGQMHLVGGTAPPIVNYAYGNQALPGLSVVQSSTFLLVYPDYRDARRIMPSFTSTGHMTTEKYGDGAGTLMPVGYSYSQIGVGVLIGWYGSAGVWNLDKKIELQSAWIDNTNLSNVVLNLAFFNRDSVANSTKNVILGVYD